MDGRSGRRDMPASQTPLAIVGRRRHSAGVIDTSSLSHERRVRGRAAQTLHEHQVTRYLAAWIGLFATVAAYQALTPVHLAMHAVGLALLNYAWPIVDPERAFLHDRWHPDCGRAPRAEEVAFRRAPAPKPRRRRSAPCRPLRSRRSSRRASAPPSRRWMRVRGRRAGRRLLRAMAQQPIEEADRADGKHDHRPAEREDELGSKPARAPAATCAPVAHGGRS